MKNRIIIGIFCALILSGSVAEILMPDKTYSASEKRKLSQKPSISVTNLISGKFGDNIESYLADQFPARDSWVTAKTFAELASGKRESGGVYFAKDGYLIDAFTSYKVKQVKTNIAALKELSDKLNVPMKVMLIPTAAQILTDKLPTFAPNLDQKKFLEYAKAQGLDTVDVFDGLSAHSDEYIYYKTDHHFTSLGAYYCYSAWKESKGETAEPITAWKSEILCDNFRGTTYAKVNYPLAPYDTITAYYKTEHKVNYNSGAYVADSIYERKYLDGSDQYAVFLNSNQAQTVVTGSGTGKLLIIKDSYANTFAQFVVDEYAEVHLIDTRFFSGSVSEYAAENGIDEVLVIYNIPNFVADTAVGGIL